MKIIMSYDQNKHKINKLWNNNQNIINKIEEYKYNNDIYNKKFDFDYYSDYQRIKNYQSTWHTLKSIETPEQHIPSNPSKPDKDGNYQVQDTVLSKRYSDYSDEFYLSISNFPYKFIPLIDIKMIFKTNADLDRKSNGYDYDFYIMQYKGVQLFEDLNSLDESSNCSIRIFAGITLGNPDEKTNNYNIEIKYLINLKNPF